VARVVGLPDDHPTITAVRAEIMAGQNLDGCWHGEDGLDTHRTFNALNALRYHGWIHDESGPGALAESGHGLGALRAELVALGRSAGDYQRRLARAGLIPSPPD
jgi:hypothetical protein